MPKNRLVQLLLEDQAAKAESEAGNTGAITKIGLDQINNIHQLINTGLLRWDKSTKEYHPLVELAKMALNPQLDDNLRFKCHAEIAKYEYPQIRSLEVQSKEDKSINVTVNIADYAQKSEVEVEAEEIETEGEDIADEVSKHQDSQETYFSQVNKQGHEKSLGSK